jgi:hypothetical protein
MSGSTSRASQARSVDNGCSFARRTAGAGQALRYAGAPRPPAAQPNQRGTDSSKLQKL